MTSRRIVLFMNDGANDYQQMQRVECQEAARRLGFALDVHAANNDAETQLAQIRAALAESGPRPPCGLLVSPVREVALIGAAYDAVRMGVAWTLLSRWHDSILDMRRRFPDVPAFSVTPDQREAGRIQGRQVQTALSPEAELVCIRGPLGTSTTIKRTAGLDDELGSHTGLKRTTFNGDWSVESGERLMREWLRLFSRSSLPRFVLAAQSDSMAMGARRALVEWQSTNRQPATDSVCFFGCNGSPGYGQRLVGAGELTATVIIPSVAGPAIAAIAAALDGRGQPPPEITIPVASFPELDVLAKQLVPRRALHH